MSKEQLETTLNITTQRQCNVIVSNPKYSYLAGANLRGEDFRGADLGGVDLRRTNLTGANLTGANLTGANLTGANLTGADLTGANLTGADLTGANLMGALLMDADLTGALLEYQIQEGLLQQIADFVINNPDCPDGEYLCLSALACHLNPIAKELAKINGLEIAGLLTLGEEAHRYFSRSEEEVLEWLKTKV